MSELIPEGWSVESLSDNIEILSGFPFKSAQFTDDHRKIGLIRIRDIIKQELKTFYNGDFDDLYVVTKGDILIGMDGDFNIVKWKIKNALLNQRICKIKAIEGKEFYSDFLFHSLEKDLQKINTATGATTVKHLSVKDIRGIQKAYPPLPEQQKIAAILSSVDEVIEKTQTQINKLKDLKTGMMQELLSPREGLEANINGPYYTEFKDSALGRIPVGWDVKPLIKIAPLQRGHDLTRAQMINGPYPIVSSSGFNGMNHEFTTEGPGVVVGRKGSIGRVHYLATNYWAHDTSLYVTDFLGNDVKYVYYLFCYMDLQQYGTKSGSPSLNRNDIHPIKVALPPVNEQLKIQTILSNIDNQIDLLSFKKEKVNNSKKALMQDLLTGKVRVQIDAE